VFIAFKLTTFTLEKFPPRLHRSLRTGRRLLKRIDFKNLLTMTCFFSDIFEDTSKSLSPHKILLYLVVQFCSSWIFIGIENSSNEKTCIDIVYRGFLSNIPAQVLDCAVLSGCSRALHWCQSGAKVGLEPSICTEMCLMYHQFWKLKAANGIRRGQTLAILWW